jgi:uncharacterized phage protein gp47/JayE
MYEDQTFQVIMNRLLAEVPNDVDKREGSLIYDMVAAEAIKFVEMYSSLDKNLRQASAKTATGIYLDLRVADYGIGRKTATKAVQKGMFYNAANAAFDIPLGSRFSAGGLNFTATSRIALGQFELECETAGELGNAAFGPLLPMDYINGLATASISELLVPGTDTETDEALRKRYFERVNAPSARGNKEDYRNWALEVDGVGDAVIIPFWNGPGTVKVVILDATKKPASGSLVSDVQAYIAPVDGTGQGKAPIGATVTVAAAAAVNINITATIVLSGSRTLGQVKADFEAAITEYLKTIAFAADPSVKYVRIGSILLDVAGVQDYSALQVNGGTGNVTVGTGAVAVKGTVTLI